MSKKILIIIPIVAVALILASTLKTPLSILAVSQVYIDPQYGYEDKDSGEWVGSHWIVLSTTSSYGGFNFYKFDEAEVKKYGDNVVADKTLLPRSEITVGVSVGKPYIVSDLQEVPYTVCKPSYAAKNPGSLISQDLKYPNHVEYNPTTMQWEIRSGSLGQQDIVVKETVGNWKTIIPLFIDVVKVVDGETIHLTTDEGPGKRLEIAGPDALIPIDFWNPNDETERFTFKLEGLLGTGYIVNMPSMMVFRDDLIFEKTGGLIGDIQYGTGGSGGGSSVTNYVNYWYGDYGQEWKEHDDHQSLYTYDIEGTKTSNPHGGVYYETIGFDYIYFPVKMSMYDNPPAIRGQPYLGLVPYLETRHNKLDAWEIDKWGQGYDISDSQIKVYMPYNSWSWLFTLKISTELADTFVWRPTYADGKIVSAAWESTGTADATISTLDAIVMEVKNVGTVDGNLRIRPTTITPSDAPILVEGNGRFFKVNETHTFKLYVQNLGPETEVHAELLFEIVNDAGAVRDSKIMSCTLLPITGVTTLNVQTVDQSSQNPISGVIVAVSYGSESTSHISNNGWATFDLGAYQGPVTLTVEESLNYYGASKQVQVSTGSNVEVLTLQKKSIPPPSPVDYGWLPWAIAVGAVMVTISVYSRKRRRGGEPT